ncbi:MAG: hypothetical protein IT331_13560 [Anaerolineae bacterium]|nr:hypothetical protein [Anaerolineae bacterium]
MGIFTEIIPSVIAKIFGVAIDKLGKPQSQQVAQPPQPVVIINVVNERESLNQLKTEKPESSRIPDNISRNQTPPITIQGTIPMVLQSQGGEEADQNPETFSDEYWETLAIDLTKKVRPEDRLILEDKRYTKSKKS